MWSETKAGEQPRKQGTDYRRNHQTPEITVDRELKAKRFIPDGVSFLCLSLITASNPLVTLVFHFVHFSFHSRSGNGATKGAE